MRLTYNVPLNPVSTLTDGANRYCGPGALSIITGLTVEAVTEIVRLRRERYNPGRVAKVQGMYGREMENALSELGYDARRVGNFVTEKPTLAQWLRGRRDEELRQTYLVLTTNHFLVVKGRKVADNVTGEPVFLRAYGKDIKAGAGRRSRIEEIYLIGKNLDARKPKPRKPKRKLARSEKTDPSKTPPTR